MTASDSNFGWTAIAVSSGMTPRQVARSIVRNNDIAYWRGEDGQIRAWQNRCPHRGMRLSYGFVRGNRLTCLYHGWTYDGTGACASIPAHPQMVPPKTITVARYSAAESGGIIWVASAEDGRPAPKLEGDWNGLRSLAIDAPAGDVVAAFAETSPSDDTTTLFPNMHRFQLPGGTAMLCAVQDVSEGSSFLHVAISSGCDAERRLAANAWSTRLRRTAERLASRRVLDANTGVSHDDA